MELMDYWIASVAGDVVEWLGSGPGALVEWLLGGILDGFEIVADAGQNTLAIIDGIFELCIYVFTSIFSVFGFVFPFVPEAVAETIGAGLVVILVAGFVKKVRE